VIAAAWLAAILVAAGWTGADEAARRDPAMPWLDAGTVEEIRSSGVVYVRDGNAFVVANRDTFIGLSDVAQHLPRERVLYCPTSGWFVGLHGEMFDRLGNYALGPASSGLMRLEVRVVDDRVEVNPERALGAPERGSVEPERRSGPFCGGDGEPLRETQPGFAVP
jgi:hypothetical protein